MTPKRITIAIVLALAIPPSSFLIWYAYRWIFTGRSMESGFDRAITALFITFVLAALAQTIQDFWKPKP